MSKIQQLCKKVNKISNAKYRVYRTTTEGVPWAIVFTSPSCFGWFDFFDGTHKECYQKLEDLYKSAEEHNDN